MVLYQDKLGGVYEALDSKVAAVASPVVADFSGTGHADSVVLSEGQRLTLRHDVTPAYGNWIEIGLTGIKNTKLALNARSSQGRNLL